MPRKAEQLGAPQATAIPDKLYFRIGDVAKLCGVETYVLRFWETEFPQLRPNKSGTGQRLYRKRDVELALRVRQLLHDEGYTIAGARQVLAQESSRSKAPQLAPAEKAVDAEKSANPRSAVVEAKLQRLRLELRELLGILSGPSRSASAEQKTKARAAARAAGPRLFE